MERKRPIEQILQSYAQFVEMSLNVAYAVTLLKSADELIQKAEESGEIPVLKSKTGQRTNRLKR